MSFALSKKYGHIAIFLVYELGLVLSQVLLRKTFKKLMKLLTFYSPACQLTR